MARLSIPLRYSLVALCLLLVPPGYLWLSLQSPWFYQTPELQQPLEARNHRVFAFGTLQNDTVRWLVTGARQPTQPAQLPGYRREGLNILADEQASTPGQVFEVSAEQLRRLDRYERLGTRYERIKLELADGSHAWVYRRL